VGRRVVGIFLSLRCSERACVPRCVALRHLCGRPSCETPEGSLSGAPDTFDETGVRMLEKVAAELVATLSSVATDEY